MAELFEPGPRMDRTARSFNEPMCAFIDRCGDPCFAEVGAERYTLDRATYAVGAQPLPVKALRRDLREWLSALDAQADRRREAGRGALPRLSWRQDGWQLEFTAQPIGSERAWADFPLVRTHLRTGWAHDTSRILGALNEKANR